MVRRHLPLGGSFQAAQSNRRAQLIILVTTVLGRVGGQSCGGSFYEAPITGAAFDAATSLFRYGPPIGNVSSTMLGGAVVTLSIPKGTIGMGGKQFWITAQAGLGAVCGPTVDPTAPGTTTTFFSLNCTTFGTCTATVPPGPLLTALTCPVENTSLPIVFSVLSIPSSRTAPAMYCAEWAASIDQEGTSQRYLQLQAQQIYQLELEVAALRNDRNNTAPSGSGNSGGSNGTASTLTLTLAAIALAIAIIHALVGVYSAVVAHRRKSSAKTRQYLQLDSLAPDEYDVQRLDDTVDGF